MNGYINIIIYIFLFIPKIVSNAYLKIILYDVNDCIYSIKGKDFFFDYSNRSECKVSQINVYPNPLLETIYEYGDRIIITIHDKGRKFWKFFY